MQASTHTKDHSTLENRQGFLLLIFFSREENKEKWNPNRFLTPTTLSGSYISIVSVGSAEVPPLSHLYAFCSKLLHDLRRLLILASRVKRDSVTREMFHWGLKSIFSRNPLLKLDNSSASGQFYLPEMLGNRLVLTKEHIATSNINKKKIKESRKKIWVTVVQARKTVCHRTWGLGMQFLYLLSLPCTVW